MEENKQVEEQKPAEKPHVVELLFKKGELVPLKGIWFEVVDVNHDGWIALGAKAMTKSAIKKIAERLVKR